MLAADIRVGDETAGVPADRTAENALALERRDKAGCVAAVLQGEENDVGLNGWEIDFDAFAGCNRVSQQARIGVIFMQA